MLLLLPILAPALMPQVLTAQIDRFVIGVLPPPPPPPLRRDVVKQPDVNHNATPIEAPATIRQEPDVDPGFESRSPGVDGGFVIGSAHDGIVEPIAPPPAPPLAPIQVGGAIRTPMKIRDAQPAYPPIAHAARVQGIVILEATIGTDGQVLNARILRSIPLLDQSALEAVRQWQFTPTLLNGVPVAVIMTVTVNFTLR